MRKLCFRRKFVQLICNAHYYGLNYYYHQLTCNHKNYQVHLLIQVYNYLSHNNAAKNFRLSSEKFMDNFTGKKSSTDGITATAVVMMRSLFDLFFPTQQHATFLHLVFQL